MNKYQLLDPRKDIVFKYLYTMYGAEADEARNLLISSFLGREIIDSVVVNNVTERSSDQAVLNAVDSTCFM